MKIIQLNVEGDKHREKVSAFLKLEDPEVVCLEEVIEDIGLPSFKERFGMEGVFVPMQFDNLGRKQGVALLSKYPLENIRVKYYWKKGEELIPDQHKESVGDEHRPLLLGEVDRDGERYVIGVTHFPVSYPGTNISDFQRVCHGKLRGVLMEEKEIIFCADTNCPRGTELFDDIATVLTDNIPQNVITTIDKDIHKAGFLPYVIDCMFTSKQYKANDVRVVGGVSDHMAVIADVSRVHAKIDGLFNESFAIMSE